MWFCNYLLTRSPSVDVESSRIFVRGDSTLRHFLIKMKLQYGLDVTKQFEKQVYSFVAKLYDNEPAKSGMIGGLSKRGYGMHVISSAFMICMFIPPHGGISNRGTSSRWP